MADQPQPLPRPSMPPPNLPQRPVMPPPITVAPMPRPTMAPPVAPRPPVTPPPAPRPPAPPVMAPTPPPAKPTEPYTSELRTMSADIGRISTGQAVVGSKPTPAPASPMVPRIPVVPVAPVTIAAPPASGGGRKVVVIIGVLLAIGVIFWIVSIMFGGGSTPAVSPTPTPSPAATLGTSVKSLSAYFPQTTTPDTSTFPSSVTDAVTGKWIEISYPQTEQFDADGKLITNGNPGPRVILIAQLNDASKANQAMMAWEATVANQEKSLFGIDPTKASAAGFADGTYQQIGIRYQNFPRADASIDWAIITASNNQNYLIISGSRQSMFYAIDQLRQ